MFQQELVFKHLCKYYNGYTVSPLYKDKPIIIGGEYKEEKYGDFQKK